MLRLVEGKRVNVVGTETPSFARDLWDEAGLKSIYSRIDRAKKTSKTIQNFFNQYARKVKDYGVFLSSFGKSNISKLEVGSLSYGLNVFGELTTTMATNQQVLANQILQTVETPVRDQAKRFQQEHMKLLGDCKKLHKEYRSRRSSCEKCSSKYRDRFLQVQGLKRDVERMKAILKDMSEEHPDYNRTQDALRKLDYNYERNAPLFQQSEEDLIREVSEFRAFRSRFDREISMHLEQMESLEKERILLIHKCINSFLSIQQQMGAQLMRNLETISKTIEHITPEKDIMRIVERDRSGLLRPSLLELRFDDELQEEEEKQKPKKRTPEQLKLKTMYEELVHHIVSGEVENYEDLLHTCTEHLETADGRQAFASSVSKQRSMDKGLQLEREPFQTLTGLADKFLDQAAKYMDIKPLKLIMIMSQTLYVSKAKVDDLIDDGRMNESTQRYRRESFTDQDKYFVAESIKTHDIWKDLRIWHEAFYDSYSAEMKKIPPMKRWHAPKEREEAARRQKEILFSSMITWGHNMSEFGVHKEQITEFIDKIALLNDMDTDRLDMLKATILAL